MPSLHLCTLHFTIHVVEQLIWLNLICLQNVIRRVKQAMQSDLMSWELVTSALSVSRTLSISSTLLTSQLKILMHYLLRHRSIELRILLLWGNRRILHLLILHLTRRCICCLLNRKIIFKSFGTLQWYTWLETETYWTLGTD